MGKIGVIHKLGTIDCDMVETTPVVFRGKLYRFEYVRMNYWANATGRSYFRFVDVKTDRTTPPFARDQHLGSAYVEGNDAFAFGVDIWGGSRIRSFQSEDLVDWKEHIALNLPGWGIYNTSVCKDDDGYTMAVEMGEPKELVGNRFTIFFARSDDLLEWAMLPLDRVFATDRYTACPAIRFLDAHYYMIYLEARPGPTYEPWIVRSQDLVHWEKSPHNPVMRHSEEDRKIANRELDAQQRKLVADAVNINNSDVDLCEHAGKTVIYYSWGNQRGTEFLAQAEYDGDLASFLQSYFAS